MTHLARIEVLSKESEKENHSLIQQAHKYLGLNLEKIMRLRGHLLEAPQGSSLSATELALWAQEVFADPILEDFAWSKDNDLLNSLPKPQWVIEIGLRPGVTDNAGHTAQEALTLVGEFAQAHLVRVYSREIYLLYGKINKPQGERLAQELLANPLIQSISVQTHEEFLATDRFCSIKVPKVILEEEKAAFKEVSLAGSDLELEGLSKKNCWALSLQELHFVRDYYQQIAVQEPRRKLALPTGPTDVEMEVIAQSWSEHCKHKIFAAHIDYEEESTGPYKGLGKKKIKSLYKTYIKGATAEVRKKLPQDYLVSVFSDNAGVVRFDPQVDLCIKVETHNSPSALDPYGGSLTGILGVNRDILGVGMGARAIANTDVFCFAPSTFPDKGQEDLLPLGLKHPRRILEGVHLGIEHGGNKSGIPTVNGAFVFDKDYAGKPLVFCGTIGVLPAFLPNGQAGAVKTPRPGDRIVMAGGRIGKDGIHGATFSSMELDETAPATAVQIGDPLTQKRLADFVLEARDLGLFSAITDNGAGGLSSSVGEMATFTNGASLELSLAPVKYPGLKPYELMISESQERMTLAVPPEKLEAFTKLAQARGVEVSDLGEFNDSGFLHVTYKGETVAYLDLHFLHDLLPPMELKACYKGPQKRGDWSGTRKGVALVGSNENEQVAQALKALLASPNIQSKEEWVRRYDHEVQAATHIKPFVGKRAHGPGNSGVLMLQPHGGQQWAGVAISCGLAPRTSHLDTYLMAQYALDEAVRNAVSVGGDPSKTALVDNFCWPDPVPSASNPDAEHKLAQLVRACEGLYDLATYYRMPFVSGKDSMKNDFIGKFKDGRPVKISVPPTVLVTALSHVPHIHHTVTSDFKEAGDLIYLLGVETPGLGGSEFLEIFDGQALSSDEQRVPELKAPLNLELYQRIHQSLAQGLLRSCHDVSDGGALVALVESMIGGELGAQVDLGAWVGKANFWSGLFGEAPGRFVVSVKASEKIRFEEFFHGLSYKKIGEVAQSPQLSFDGSSIPLTQLSTLWRGK